MATKVVSIKSTPAAPKAAKETTVAKTAKTKAAELSAARDAAQSIPVLQLVEEFHLSDAGAVAAQNNTDKLLSMLDASKIEASNYRVIRSRIAYQIATHPDVATKRFPVNILGAARVIVAKPGMDDKEITKVANIYRTTLQWSVKAGEALAQKGMVYLTGTPTEGERAVVEKSLDQTVRAKAAKGNAKTKAKVAAAAAKGKAGDTPADGGTPVTPAEVLKAAKAVLAMASGLTSTGGVFTLAQADVLADVLAEIESVVAGSVSED